MSIRKPQPPYCVEDDEKSFHARFTTIGTSQPYAPEMYASTFAPNLRSPTCVGLQAVFRNPEIARATSGAQKNTLFFEPFCRPLCRKTSKAECASAPAMFVTFVETYSTAPPHVPTEF